MSRDQIRASQIVRTFGPGAMVDFPDSSILVAGLEHWHFGAPGRRFIEEPRLVAKLRAILSIPDLKLCHPPESGDPKDKARPDVVGWRFPRWFIVHSAETTSKGFRRRRLVHENSLVNNRYDDKDRGRMDVVPTRFVRACRKGHIGDIDWRAFVHNAETGCLRELWVEERGTSGELENVFIVCECGQERTMSQAARLEMRALGFCDGSRPWLGRASREKCGEPSRLLVRSASNAWFPQSLPVISIPDAGGRLLDIVRELWEDHLEEIETPAELSRIRKKPTPKARLDGFDDASVLRAIERVRTAGTTMLDRPVKEVEFEALSEAAEEIGTETAEGDFCARTLTRDVWQGAAMDVIERVVLVHRLREVCALVGFTRFESAGTDINGELALDVQRAPLSFNANWLPAVESRGEGIFLQFRADAIAEWLARPEVERRAHQLEAGFDAWLHEHQSHRWPFPGAPYYLLHSFSHLLLTAISLECGYPASSLRERIYAAEGHYGILIYTGSSDSEGTLGGLVAAGRWIRRHVLRALETGALCSNDPICTFHDPSSQSHQPLLGAACHGCLLISETSCELSNNFLDRTLVVPTLERRGAELFRNIGV